MKTIIFEKTSFGSITISGKDYSQDVCLHTDGRITGRDKSRSTVRIQGHRELGRWELEILLEEKPEYLIIGTGQYGILPMTEESKSWLETIKEDIPYNTKSNIQGAR